MASRSCPPSVRELPPHQQCCLAFSFGKILILITRQCDWGISICLRAQQRVVLSCPPMQRLEVIIVGQFSQRLPPIVPDRSRHDPHHQSVPVNAESGRTLVAAEIPSINQESNRIRSPPDCHLITHWWGSDRN